MRHVLVTGGAGYIGSHTCKALARRGMQPVVLDNLVYGHRWAVRWGPFYEGDIADAELVRRIVREHRIESLVHFAAYAYVGESMQQPQKYFDNNVVRGLSLLHAAREAGVRHVVFSSTCAVYGEPESVPIAETQTPRPVNPYGESKLFFERALHWLGTCHGLRWMALRYFNAAGADPEGELGEEHEPETHLVPLVIRALLGRIPRVQIYGTDYPTADGTAIRDYIHVTDLAAAHVKALEHLQAGGESAAVNLGTGTGHSVRQLVQLMGEIAGKPVPSLDAPRRAGDPPVLVADPSRARALLGWSPRFSRLEQILETAWQWHLSRGSQATQSVGGEEKNR
jgi:UDP-arabinose 4-epimerase